MLSFDFSRSSLTERHPHDCENHQRTLRIDQRDFNSARNLRTTRSIDCGFSRTACAEGCGTTSGISEFCPTVSAERSSGTMAAEECPAGDIRDSRSASAVAGSGTAVARLTSAFATADTCSGFAVSGALTPITQYPNSDRKTVPVIKLISSRLLTRNGQPVGRVGVDIGAEFVRRDFPGYRLADGNHPIWRRCQVGGRVKPLPDMRLFDFRLRNGLSEFRGQRDLTACDLYCFF